MMEGRYRRAAGSTGSATAAQALRLLKRPSGTLSVGLIAAFVLVIVIFVWSVEILTLTADSLEDMALSEDANQARFSDHCAAATGFTSLDVVNAPPDAGSPFLQSTVVMTSHGDSSASSPWPGDQGSPALWDCTPEALPRYWRLNKHVDFTVVGLDGSHLERSFDPELTSPGSSYSDYVCGAGQLTPMGFRQMVSLGRHLSFAYEALLARVLDSGGTGRLHVRSVDSKPSLASTVGILMSLLASPQVIEALEATSVPILVETNATMDIMRSHSSYDTESSTFELGNQLLARWCHQLSWPCTKDGCLSIEKAASLVAQGESTSCHTLPGATGATVASTSHARRVFDYVGSLLKENNSFSLLSVEPLVLSVTLAAILGGDAVCREPLVARPPFASHLVLERWMMPGRGPWWRIVWNSIDITPRLVGCTGNTGCDEHIVERALSQAIGEHRNLSGILRKK